jgi:tRNA1(Val) A37 N6-methylase TrmN6
LTAQKCCSVNGIDGRVELVMSDLAQAIQYRLENSVDLLLFNPPYVPTLPQEVSN